MPDFPMGAEGGAERLAAGVGHAVLSHLLFAADPPPAGCGQKYAYLVRSGQHTAEHPCAYKPWCSDEDVDIWRAKAEYAFKLVRTAWNQLYHLETTIGAYPRLDSIRPFVTVYEKHYAGIGESPWWKIAGEAEQVAELVTSIQHAACGLEQLNDAITSATAEVNQGGGGVLPPVIPVPDAPQPSPFPDGSAWGETSGNIVWIAAIGLFALLAFQSRGRWAK